MCTRVGERIKDRTVRKMIDRWIAEATECDFKVALEVKKPKSWLKSVSAFANGIGGTLFFGIDDDRNVIGLSDAQTDAETISRLIKERHLAGLPQQRHNRLLPVGRQDSVQGIGHRTDACRQLPGSVQTASIIVNKRNTTRRYQVVFLTLSGRISFVSTTWGFWGTCRQRKEQT